MNTAHLDTDLLTQLVRAKHACLGQLRDMGLRQLELIEQGDTTALLDLLSSKQRPLLDLQRIERALDPFRKQDPERRAWRSPEDRARCAAWVQHCETLLAEIVRQEKQSEEILSQRRDEAARQLTGFRTAGQARSAYMDATRQEVSHLDLSSGG